MPVGLFNSLAGFMRSLPGAAFGNTPASAIGDLMDQLMQCKVIVPDENPKAQ